MIDSAGKEWIAMALGCFKLYCVFLVAETNDQITVTIEMEQLKYQCHFLSLFKINKTKPLSDMPLPSLAKHWIQSVSKNGSLAISFG
ncbi:MAG: hypothetical protein Q8933_17205 [Bacteroidota bacterium]|nr:hypothetical protein [Bacteroidota bacterium]